MTMATVLFAVKRLTSAVRKKAPNSQLFCTEKGTFLEDGVLPGYYYVNDDGTIRLNYEGNLPETVFYYSVHDDVMTIEYPWVMAETP